MLFILMGCSLNGMTGSQPPKARIEVGEKSYQTKLGTYCWKRTCVDTAGSVELLKGKTPVKVYDYGVWWMDEKEENLSKGDAFYAFVLEVE